MLPEPSSAESFWIGCVGNRLAQGDYLLACPVAVFPPDFGMTEAKTTLGIKEVDLIVVTQTCDLENGKVAHAALCPIFSVAQLRSIDEKYGKPDRLEEIRRGKWEALHMLSSTVAPDDNADVRIVDSREIHSLPVGFLASHAGKLGNRWRLKSPYLEHFSQAFARFFMRVGLPSTIRRFK